MPNRFDEAENLDQLVHMVVGAASVCWENPGGAGVFDDSLAIKVANDGIERIKQLYEETVKCLSCEQDTLKMEATKIVVAGKIKEPICKGCFDTIATIAKVQGGKIKYV
jgi:hypothetical protein